MPLISGKIWLCNNFWAFSEWNYLIKKIIFFTLTMLESKRRYFYMQTWWFSLFIAIGIFDNQQIFCWFHIRILVKKAWSRQFSYDYLLETASCAVQYTTFVVSIHLWFNPLGMRDMYTCYIRCWVSSIIPTCYFSF